MARIINPDAGLASCAEPHKFNLRFIQINVEQTVISYSQAFAALFLMELMFFSCTGVTEKNNQLTEEEMKQGWVLLFDGKSTNGWHLYNRGNVPSVWIVKNDELYCDANSKREQGDLTSDKEFENFDLQFDWKIEKMGNSGVFINVIERPDIPTTYASGPEYQLLEKSHPDYPDSSKRSGCLFGFGTKNSAAPTNFGEWYHSRIKQVGGKIQFYLNGVLTVEQDFSSPAWFEEVRQSNFKNSSEFGKHTRGHIALQQWAKGISFRNIKIKKL
jgi:3-keto-disaccharide hydrolase